MAEDNFLPLAALSARETEEDFLRIATLSACEPEDFLTARGGSTMATLADEGFLCVASLSVGLADLRRLPFMSLALLHCDPDEAEGPLDDFLADDRGLPLIFSLMLFPRLPPVVTVLSVLLTDEEEDKPSLYFVVFVLSFIADSSCRISWLSSSFAADNNPRTRGDSFSSPTKNCVFSGQGMSGNGAQKEKRENPSFSSFKSCSL